MSRIKTATTALTAALLVTGIGIAVAQTAEPTTPANPMTAAPSEQTPADPNAQLQQLPPTQQNQQSDTAAPTMQQQTPPVDNPSTTAPLPSDSMSRSTLDNTTPANPMSSTNNGMTGSTEPAPRADRN